MASTPYYPASIQRASEPIQGTHFGSVELRCPAAVARKRGVSGELMWATRIITSRKALTSTASRRTIRQTGWAFAAANCGYTGTQLNPNLYRPYQGWGNITPLETVGNSNYESLQITVRATAWKHLTLSSSYTWSHAFDVLDGELFSNIDNPFNARWDYGPAGWDRRQIFVTSFVYPLPFFRDSRARATKALLGRWQLSGVFTLESGTPFSVGNGFDNLGLGGDTRTGRISWLLSHIRRPVSSGSAPTRSRSRPRCNGAPRRGTTWSDRERATGTSRCTSRSNLPKGSGSSSGGRRSTLSTTRSSTAYKRRSTPGNFAQLTGTQPQRIFELGAKLLF